MRRSLVLTLLGPDRPGLVEAMAALIARHGGNWLESRMAQLAGQFAGILRVEVPPENVAPLQAALGGFEAQGLRIVALGGAAAPVESVQEIDLEIVGQDHSGIVRDLSQVLVRHGVNIEELITDRSSAPMAGSLLFSARARLRMPTAVDTARLKADLEKIAHDLMVDLKLVPR
jgi:glycine cleavage system regulatory protein